ncbi:MAG: cache domain-containing protein, partial [Candidatus Fermentibacteraceae bacterium]|nr:cache domain-containing protein [Candidatus Fermentibacteraceae bacterium]
MNSRTISLRRMIVIPTILLVVASIFLVGYFSMRNGKLAVTTVSRALRTEITSRISSRINKFLNTPQILCVLTSDLIGEGFLDPLDPVEMEKWFFKLVEIYPSVSSIYLGNTAGGISDAGRETSGELYTIRTENYAAGKFYKYRCDLQGNPIELLNELDNFDARNRSWFIESSDARGSVLRNDPYLVYTGNEISISTSMAVLDPQGVFAGVVACDVFLSQLSNFLRNLQIGTTGIAFITDSSGDVLASSVNPEYNLEYTLAPASENADSIIHCVGIYADSLYGSDWDIGSVVEFQLECSKGRSFVQISPFMDSLGKTYFIVTSIPE